MLVSTMKLNAHPLLEPRTDRDGCVTVGRRIQPAQKHFIMSQFSPYLSFLVPLNCPQPSSGPTQALALKRRLDSLLGHSLIDV